MDTPGDPDIILPDALPPAILRGYNKTSMRFACAYSFSYRFWGYPRTG